MKVVRHLVMAAVVCVAGCMYSGPERLISLQDTELKQHVVNKTLIFTHGREAWVPGADEPLFGPAVIKEEVHLDDNGEAHAHLGAVSWWVNFGQDEHAPFASLNASDVRVGGDFRLFLRPVPGETNSTPSKYVLTIKKP